VKAAVDNPGWFKKAMSNRYVQIVGARARHVGDPNAKIAKP